jgi:hypothetical protein
MLAPDPSLRSASAQVRAATYQCQNADYQRKHLLSVLHRVLNRISAGVRQN